MPLDARSVCCEVLTSRFTTAAKAALKRKKTHEHSLDQTIAQIGTLEQQINAIESANINRETLLAMQKAGKAMKDIHGGLTVEKVDQTMYEYAPLYLSREEPANTGAGKTYGSRTNSARRSWTPSRGPRSARWSTRTTWKPSWRACNRSSWTSKCSRLAPYPSRIRSAGCRTCPTEQVSLPGRHRRRFHWGRLLTHKPVAAKSSKAPVQEEDDEEAELRKLQAEMAM